MSDLPIDPRSRGNTLLYVMALLTVVSLLVLIAVQWFEIRNYLQIAG